MPIASQIVFYFQSFKNWDKFRKKQDKILTLKLSTIKKAQQKIRMIKKTTDQMSFFTNRTKK